MATDQITRIDMPELNKGDERAVLTLTTKKNQTTGRIYSVARVSFVRPDGIEICTLGADYARNEYTNQARGTQANIDRQHVAVFAPETIERIKADAREHYRLRISLDLIAAEREADERRAASVGMFGRDVNAETVPNFSQTYPMPEPEPTAPMPWDIGGPGFDSGSEMKLPQKFEVQLPTPEATQEGVKDWNSAPGKTDQVPVTGNPNGSAKAADVPATIWVWFSATGTIRKWDTKPFDNGVPFVCFSMDEADTIRRALLPEPEPNCEALAERFAPFTGEGPNLAA